MPPRFPHGLKKPPSKMDKPELAVFAMLSVSVVAGLYQMGSDARRVYVGSSSSSSNAVAEEETDNDRRDRALDAIGKCNVHLQNFGQCAQDNGMWVLFRCRDLNTLLKECLMMEQNRKTTPETVEALYSRGKEGVSDESWSTSVPAPRRHS